MSLPVNLQKLPPQALDVIRYLGTRKQGADVDTILAGTGLTERSFGKAIRRLVTRYYVEMLGQGFYKLTANGQQAVRDLRVYDGVEPDTFGPDSAAAHTRQLTAVLPRQLVAGGASVLLVGFNAPDDDSEPLQSPGRLILRVSAPGCDVHPTERPLEVTGSSHAGPVRFQVKPRREGDLRLRIEVFQLVTLQELVRLGGMYCDINAGAFPTPLSAETQTLGTMMGLYAHTEN
ncbi:MAG: hypothetical protein JW966_04060 [Anaerolineae bacterium]|nr:hypothetical protein [Anaerolineae bacterium]